MNKYNSVLGQIIGLFPKAEFYELSKKSGADMSAKIFSFTYRALWEWPTGFFQTPPIEPETYHSILLRTNWTA